jgi:hypothetical protein
MLLLLLENGKLLGAGYTDLMVGGAYLADLVLKGRVGAADGGGSVKEGRLVVRSKAPTDDALLDAALQRLLTKPGYTPNAAVQLVGKDARLGVLHRLADDGIVSQSPRKVLGLVPASTWPTVDGRPAAELKSELNRVVDGSTRPDAEQAVLVALLLAGGVLHKALPTDDRKAQKARAKQLAQIDWAPTATRKVLQDVVSGVGAAVAGATWVYGG